MSKLYSGTSVHHHHYHRILTKLEPPPPVALFFFVSGGPVVFVFLKQIQSFIYTTPDIWNGILYDSVLCQCPTSKICLDVNCAFKSLVQQGIPLSSTFPFLFSTVILPRALHENVYMQMLSFTAISSIIYLIVYHIQLHLLLLFCKCCYGSEQLLLPERPIVRYKLGVLRLTCSYPWRNLPIQTNSKRRQEKHKQLCHSWK